MEFEKLEIEGAYSFTPPVYKDDRGLFANTYQEAAFAAALGKPLFPVKDLSHNLSHRGVLRGIHYTTLPPGRAKYVCCPRGRVRDYLVDLRVGSPTFGTWTMCELSQDNCRALYIPVGLGHAFISLEDETVISYVMSEGYVPSAELAVSALDPTLGLPLPEGLLPTQSHRDMEAPTLAEARDRGLLPGYEESLATEAALWQ
ncbi:dTDP-4-dehydrorhamnose 3,5-epimerase family protein [Streptomyces sp. ST2-7A]|uniref:dTDP-4-dehydrorhamnose 3,5-epimerase family protein n=1 Tax=Streptomyces sp. ST2-7A TaxID=2907214 RepID=UPI001F1A0909|nr:dTDP-4-dehydrorhamnose 3,5-epimerase family protein [Streptomyces sp. ST2-7A]MCE7083356.1 dTDP-4-dehydrorhamnose 3,5-epimerase family protein [Streptomyces sp. ST2-7A]